MPIKMLTFVDDLGRFPRIWDCGNYQPTKHDVKDIIKTFEDYLQVLQTKTSRHQNVNNLEIICYLRFA